MYSIFNYHVEGNVSGMWVCLCVCGLFALGWLPVGLVDVEGLFGEERWIQNRGNAGEVCIHRYCHCFIKCF